ncbi:hypothetical protein EVAR_52817_1 [Eumeta japonica]|uniref:Uncharacterized protein n=1 Tax=Eumeta variegata TaxID=151549 RepID=A0A4C2A1C6_EUMVA|nr:hypothetical protein EVAR_52817_1 [Eumeta japonica]
MKRLKDVSEAKEVCQYVSCKNLVSAYSSGEAVLCAAAVSLLLERIGRWSGRGIARSVFMLVRSAQAERDNESCFSCVQALIDLQDFITSKLSPLVTRDRSRHFSIALILIYYRELITYIQRRTAQHVGIIPHTVLSKVSQTDGQIDKTTERIMRHYNALAVTPDYKRTVMGGAPGY